MELSVFWGRSGDVPFRLSHMMTSAGKDMCTDLAKCSKIDLESPNLSKFPNILVIPRDIKICSKSRFALKKNLLKLCKKTAENSKNEI